MALLAWSTNIPMLWSSPLTVPTSESCSSGSGGRGGFGGAFGTDAVTAGGGGGRRDGEKIGRSRVFDNVASGIAQSGLPLIVPSRLLRGPDSAAEFAAGA